MVGKSARLAVIPQQSTQNSKFAITDIREKNSELFLLFNTSVDFSLRNNFANSGFCAKVSVPVHIYNSLEYCITILELSCTIFKQIFYSFSSSLSRAERDDFL